MERLKQISQDSVVYGLGGVVAKSISFLLLPVYTRVFTTGEYGTMEMLSVLGSFVGAIAGLGMDSAQSMYFFKYKHDDEAYRAKIVSAILQWRILWGAAVLLMASCGAPLLNAWLFDGELKWAHFAVVFISVLFSQIMSQSADVLRLLFRPWPYLAITLSHSVLSALLILTFVVVLKMGIMGLFVGATVASFCVAIFGWIRIRKYWNFEKLHYQLWPRLVRFGAPLVPSFIAYYFMGTADRWFVQHYHGAEVLGQYAVGAKFAMLLGFAVETFRRAWLPVGMDAMHSSDGPETFRTIARVYMGLGCGGVVLLTYLAPSLVGVVAGEAYHSAWPIVGILAWQVLFYGFFLIASAGLWKTEKVYLSLPLAVGAALIGLLLNWLLVPAYGPIGASLATAFTYLIWISISIIISERLWWVGYEIPIMIIQIGLSIFFAFFYIFNTNEEWALYYFVLAVVLATFLCCSSFSKRQWQYILSTKRV